MTTAAAFRAYYPQIVAYARARGSRDPENVAAETFARAWANRAKLDASSDLRAWLYRVAANLATDELRHIAVAPDMTQAATVAYDRHDELAFLEALAPLNSRHRRFLGRHYLLGASWPEVAAAEGVRSGAARIVCTRALERLRATA